MRLNDGKLGKMHVLDGGLACSKVIETDRNTAAFELVGNVDWI